MEVEKQIQPFLVSKKVYMYSLKKIKEKYVA